ADLEIPLPGSADPPPRMWQPKLEARAVQELRLKPTDEVLEIGTGSGYLTALLAACSQSVTSVEIDTRLAAAARERLAAQRVSNARIETGDGSRGWGTGRYDAIIVTASTPILPESIVDQLKPEGRLFAIVGVAPAMHARLVVRDDTGDIVAHDLFETVVAP